MIQKSIILVLLSFTGAGYFIGKTEIGDSLSFITSEFHQEVKKKNVAKPKSFYTKRKSDLTGSKNQPLSFFLTLNDPSLNRIVDLNGKIIKKHDYFPDSVRKVPFRQKVHRKTLVSVPRGSIKKASLKTAVPPIPVFKPKKFEVAPRPKNLYPLNRNPKILSEKPSRNSIGSSGTPLTGGEESNNEREGQTLQPENPSHVNIGSSGTLVSYVVQVSSFRQKQQAKFLKTALRGKGYATFIGKIELPENKGTWYRVYIGRYFNHSAAEMAATKFYREENRQAMVIRQSG